MKANHHILYANGSAGVNIWEIWSESNVIRIRANGGMYTETIKEGKGGRNIFQQVQLRVKARVRGKLDSGFKYTQKDLIKGNTNQLDLPMPMLATHLKDAKRINYDDLWIQPKYDGHRCLITNSGAYSRRGKPIETIPEILESFAHIPDGVVLDGELYAHGYKLQTIASWAKRRQKDTLKLRFFWYDVINTDLPYNQRGAWINNLPADEHWVEKVPTWKYDKEVSPGGYCMIMREQGYEGAIARVGSSMYLPGKRSKELLKIKTRFDAEFECVDVIPNRDESQGILIVKTLDGRKFKTLAPGTNHEKLKTYQEKEKYIGKFVTCEYAELSEDEIPQHCVATRWRKDL